MALKTNLSIKDLREAVKNEKATFVEEEHVQDDMFELHFEYEGVEFSISAHGNERWLMDEDEFVTIYNWF